MQWRATLNDWAYDTWFCMTLMALELPTASYCCTSRSGGGGGGGPL
jgi:hypothetical protein